MEHTLNPCCLEHPSLSRIPKYAAQSTQDYEELMSRLCKLLLCFILNIFLLLTHSALENQNLPDRWAVHWSMLREMGFFLLFGSKAGGACGVWWCVASPLTAHVLYKTSTAKFNLIWTVDFTGVA